MLYMKAALWSIHTGFFLNYFLNYCDCNLSMGVFVLKSQKWGTQAIPEPK